MSRALLGENTENGKNRTLRLWHVRRSRAVLGLSVAVSGWSTAQPGVRRSGERASESGLSRHFLTPSARRRWPQPDTPALSVLCCPNSETTPIQKRPLYCNQPRLSLPRLSPSLRSGGLPLPRFARWASPRQADFKKAWAYTCLENPNPFGDLNYLGWGPRSNRAPTAPPVGLPAATDLGHQLTGERNRCYLI